MNGRVEKPNRRCGRGSEWLVLAAILLSLFSRVGVNAENVNIAEFKAVGDGVTVNTTAIQAAIDRCADTGGGRVTVPLGRFLTGTIILKSDVELHLETGAVLLGGDRHEDYPRLPTPAYRSLKDNSGFYSLICAENAKNIAITGSGTIDGQGKKQLPRPELKKNDRDGRPRAILFVSCDGVTVTGVKLRNSGCWMQHYLNCDNVRITDLDVYNHSNRNNDGVDIDGCRRVVVANCRFDTDDDAICLKSTGPAPCEDVAITNCTVSSHCTAIKAGTESTGGFKRIAISNCTISPSVVKTKFYGLPAGKVGLELLIVDGGTLDGVTVNNIVMQGVSSPFCVRLGDRGRPYLEGGEKTPPGSLRNVIISNLIATNVGDASAAVSGVPGHNIENLTLSNIQIIGAGGVKETVADVPENPSDSPGAHMWGPLPSFGIFVRHARNVRMDGLLLGVSRPDQRFPIWAQDVDDLAIRSAKVIGPCESKTFVFGDQITGQQIESPLNWQGTVFEMKKR